MICVETIPQLCRNRLDFIQDVKPKLREIMRLILKKLWRRWKGGVHKINDGLAFVLMTCTYVVAVTPIAIGFKIRGSDLLDRGLDKKRKTYWNEKEEEEQTIKRVQRPY